MISGVFGFDVCAPAVGGGYVNSCEKIASDRFRGEIFERAI
jgi:hypothetical protein